MKNKIYSYFLFELLSNFLITLISLCAIAWIIQAVNYLDYITEDGYSLKSYFLYSLYNFPKIVSRLLPFVFFLSLLFIFIKFEKNDELLILWVSGFEKRSFLNFIIIISICFSLLYLILGSIINPYSLTKSRNILRDSKVELMPTLLKEKKFNDTIQNITFFIDKKNKDGLMKNIFIRDETVQDKSKTIIAKSGKLVKKNNKTLLILNNGTIQNEKLNGKINFLKFSKTTLDLSSFSTKTIKVPKIQERKILTLLKCLDFFKDKIKLGYKAQHSLLCKDSKIKVSISNEINRRLGMPLYLPLLAIIVSYVLISNREKKNEFLYYSLFCVCLAIVILTEIFVRYSGKSTLHTFLFYLIPVTFFIFNYLNLNRLFKN